MPIKTSLIFALLLLCANAMAEPKATIVGRFRIKNPSGLFYGKSKSLEFVQEKGARRQCLIRKKDSGYFSMKLIPGINVLKQIHYLDGTDYIKNLPEYYARIDINTSDNIYYVGDIVVTWDVLLKDESSVSKIGGGLVGALVGMSLDNKRDSEAKTLEVSIEPATIARFARELELDSASIIIAPLHIDK